MDTKAIATLQNGSKVSGWLTTAHSAKFSGSNKDMADMILELLEWIDRLKIEKNILKNTLRGYQK